MNDQNLRVPTSDEAREIGRLGGIASGQARRERKRLRECLEEALALETEFDGQTMSNAEAIAASMVREARNGSVRAFVEVRNTVGEKPVEKVITNELSQEEFEKAKAEIDRILFGEDEE